MASRPWEANQKCNIGPYSAFSTSPSQLQEVTFDTEPNGKVSISQIQTAFANSAGESSCSSMKQHEEQVAVLRKENFHLKLRVYFLEERLGNSTPVPMQDVLEDNVKLQVELEELRRQLCEKQDLLTAAVKAMDDLEQQANKNVHTQKDPSDSDNGSLLQYRVQQLEEKSVDSESALEKSINGHLNDNKIQENVGRMEFTEDEKEELLKLKREHLKACQMIRGCMIKIKNLEKDLKEKELKLEELVQKNNAADAISILEKLKMKDDQILHLEENIRVLANTQKNAMAAGYSGNENLQQVLTKRLQGLAYFLDSLLSHKCVIGHEKREMAKNLLEQSLAFLDETAAGDLTVDDSNVDISNILRLEDLSLVLGHHQENQQEDRFNNPVMSFPDNAPSESDCWSEPDRSVSLARMGLSATLNHTGNNSDESRHRNRRIRASANCHEKDLLIEINTITREKVQLEEKLNRELEIQSQLLTDVELLQNKLKQEISEREVVVEHALATQCKVTDLEKLLTKQTEELRLTVLKYNEAEITFKKEQDNCAKLKLELLEMENRYKARVKTAEDHCSELKEEERKLRRQVDEATLQASQSALDRTRSAHDKLQAERTVEQVRIQLEESEKLRRDAELKVATLDVKLSNLAGEQELLQLQLQLVRVPCVNSEDDRPTSPDLGIDSDRFLSSLENVNIDLQRVTKGQLLRENQELREKLERSKAALAETVSHLNEANSRKHRVQRAICRQIHKTQDVLRQARTNLQAPLSPPDEP